MFINKLLPYLQLARLHRPVPILLLLWPCFLGLALSKGSLFDYGLFLLGTVAMRSAGCIINDIADQDFDRQVTRTKTRPLAARIITTNHALLEVAFFLSVGFIVWLFLGQTAKYHALVGAILMVIYPFVKRITNWPQLFLGFTFNYGLIVAITHTGNFSWHYLSLFFALVMWTIFYDTIYAFADIEDDKKTGIKSTAIVMKNSPKTWLTTCNILMHGMLFVFLKNFGLLCLIPIIIGFIYLQILLIKWQIEEIKSCLKTFGNCHFWGLGLWLWIELIRIISP